MKLVIQGIDVQTRDLKQLAKLARSNRIEQVASQAFWLRDARMHDRIAAYCEAARLDFALVPDERRLLDFKLLAMDMDSTLITIECIDEIADLNGLKQQVAEITAAAMRGEIEFAESLTRRVALLQGLHQSALQRVYDERLQLSPGAETLIAELQRLEIKTLLVSGGFTFFTERLRARLALEYTASNTLEIVDGKLSGKVAGSLIGAQGKADALIRVRNALGIARDQTIAIGDGANDLKMLAEAGVSIAYRAKPVVRQTASYALDYVGLDGVLNLFARDHR